MDFQQLASELLARSESLCEEWFPAGKKRGHEYQVGNLYGSPGDSLKINLNTGLWKDFASGEKGGDLIALYAAMEGVTMGEAYKQLTNGHAPAVMSRPAPPPKPKPKPMKIITPVPDSAEPPDFIHYKHGRPVMTWHYRDADCDTLGYTARYEPVPGEKEIIPWVFSEEKGWVNKQWPVPRPLYGLDLLAERPDAPVLITEGEKDADAARRIAGHVYVVMTWPGGSEAWDRADFSVLKGRSVLLWPDDDDAGRKCVAEIGVHLLGIAAEVKALRVDGHTKDGAADFKGGYKEFRKWASERVTVMAAPVDPEPKPPTTPEPPKPPKKEEAPAAQPHGYTTDEMIYSSTPMKTAQLFHDTLPEGGRILFWRGEFYSWDGCRYVVRDKVYIEQRLYRFMAAQKTIRTTQSGEQEIVAFNPKTNLVNDVSHALRAVCYADIPEPQCWIEPRDSDPSAHEIIAFRNGFLHWPTRTLISATDRLFVTSALDFDYDESASEPTEWLRFLGGLWLEDNESIEALADMFGYLLTDDTSQQKMFMLIGPPRSGKGTILRVLESLVGYHNRVSPSLASLGTQFGLQPLIGKRLAMISDARLSGKADQQPIVENLLRISGEDSLSIDRKNISAWSGKMAVRFVLASNELPSFSDSSAALANRFMLFKFERSFLGHEDHGLTNRLLKELPGILIWALDGLARLQKRGYLIRPKSANELALDLVEQTSPINAFVAQRCRIGPNESCNRDELYKAWKSWCEDEGRDHHGTKVAFGRNLSAAFASVKRSQPAQDGTRLNLYSGISIKSWEYNT